MRKFAFGQDPSKLYTRPGPQKDWRAEYPPTPEQKTAAAAAGTALAAELRVEELRLLQQYAAHERYLEDKLLQCAGEEARRVNERLQLARDAQRRLSGLVVLPADRDFAIPDPGDDFFSYVRGEVHGVRVPYKFGAKHNRQYDIGKMPIAAAVSSTQPLYASCTKGLHHVFNVSPLIVHDHSVGQIAQDPQGIFGGLRLPDVAMLRGDDYKRGFTAARGWINSSVNQPRGDGRGAVYSKFVCTGYKGDMFSQLALPHASTNLEAAACNLELRVTCYKL